MERDVLAAEIFDVAHLAGSFRLRSGRIAQEYFDKYRFESDPRLLRAIAEGLAPLVPAGTQVLAGLELGGVPLATALGLTLDIPVAFVRKQAKAYGTKRLAEGADLAGRHTVIVEDVVTSGGQVIASGRELRGLGALVEEVVCVVDRGEGGAGALIGHGLRMHALFRADELRAAARP